jgi:hypothetical protein
LRRKKVNHEDVVDLATVVENMTEAYEKAVIREHDLGATLEAMEGYVIGKAYADGVIDGKNAQMRDAQEAVVLMEDEGLGDLGAELMDAKLRVAEAKGCLEGAKTLASLTRAWLYSQQVGNS